MARKRSSDYVHVEHPFEPTYFDDSKILVLGSFPSTKSREAGFYYGHPNNRFWALLSNLYEKNLPKTIEDKMNFLKDIHIALYDVISSCDIISSSDASIKNAMASNVLDIVHNSSIGKIICNGRKAGDLFLKYQANQIPNHIKVVVLPSTSPANAKCSLSDLMTAWGTELFS